MIQVKRLTGWGIAFLLILTIIVVMNNRFVHSMIYPAPMIAVPQVPPVSLKEPDWSLEMHAWLHEPEVPSAKQVMLYFHGNGENLETMRQSGLLEDLKQFRIPFLVVDYPGYGRSKGKASEQSILHNSVEAAKWLKKQYPDHKLIVIGWSLGASVAVQTAAQSEEADALIAMSTWTSLPDVAGLHFSDWLVRFVLNERYNALEAASKIRIPALFIHGEEDELIPVDQGKTVAAAMKMPARWIQLPGVGHNDLLAQPIVWQEITNFLNP